MADLSGSIQFRSIKTTLPSGLMGGVYFETPAGTPSLLNSYQCQSFTISFSGVWAAPQTVNVFAERIGNAVTLTFALTSAGAAISGYMQSGVGSILSVFCPSSNIVWNSAIVTDNSLSQNGVITVTPSGIVTVSVVTGTFAATGLAGWPKLTIAYSTVAL